MAVFDDKGCQGPSKGLLPIVESDESGIVVTLPSWVDSLVFERLRAVHQPAGRKRSFDNNLYSSRESVLTYLGTYFPRSLAESYVIFSSLLSDKSYSNLISSAERLRICSLGTGTGGDLLGLVLALRGCSEYCPFLEIVSVEGNESAHRCMEAILDEAFNVLGIRASIQTVDYVFAPPKPFWSFVSGSGLSGTYDFVITSKMLNELANAKISTRPYYEFCAAFAPLLSPSGVLLSLDVTSMVDSDRSWAPSLLNGQTNAFLSDNKGFGSILPLLCNRFEDGCDRECYTQNTVKVSHSRKKNECSKICYRVIGHRDFVNKLAHSPALWDCPITKNNKAHCAEFLEA